MIEGLDTMDTIENIVIAINSVQSQYVQKALSQFQSVASNKAFMGYQESHHITLLTVSK